MVKRNLTIIGMGLIGGSIAASLKSGNKPWRIRAVDRRRTSLDYSLRNGLADEVSQDLGEAVVAADLVLLAAPVGSIGALLEALAPHLRSGQVVTDVGSTKETIIADARTHLPAEVTFVGGHPVAGSDRSGVENSVPGLFEGRTCVVTPEPDTPRLALERVAELWGDLGAEVLYLDAATHDRLFAYVSHLPHVVAYALVHAVSRISLPAQGDFTGGGLREMTRLARSSPALWRDICLGNRRHILEAIDRLQEELGVLRTAVDAADGRVLQEYFLRSVETKGKPWMP